MPLPPSITTGAMIAGTVVTAAGLNLGVLSLNQPPSGDGQTVQASETAAAPVAEAVEAALTPPVDPTAGVQPDPQGQLFDDTITGGVAGATVQVVTAPADDAGAGRSSGAAVPSSAAPTSAAAPAPATNSTPAPTALAPTTQAPASAAPRTEPPTTRRPATTDAPANQAPTTVAPTTPAPTSAQTRTDYLTSEWEGVAEIILAFHDGSTLEFWSATPENNWVYKVEKRTGTEVEVEFFNTQTENEAKFKAEVRNGRVKISKEA